ncbi:MAG: hypothetical protein Q7T61_01590 [Caulobacter sp.]|nr:hypothetical protein [Caulobacter sp.]
MGLPDQPLADALAKVLADLEAKGEIVICRPVANLVVQRLHDTVLELQPRSDLTAGELSGLRALIFQAIRDKRFFDWEKPTLTGFTADQFEAIAAKLPNV